MKSSLLVLHALRCSAALVWIAGAIALHAQEAHEHHHTGDIPEKLGRVNFVITGDADTQRQFNRAMALLHSFWYDEAEKAFAEIAKAHPDCAMAYWGIAMSRYHQIWAPPTATDLKAGAAAVEQAKAAGPKTDRERDYIAAIETFYKDSDKLDHLTRTRAYEKAMDEVSQRNPNDHEAAILHALAMLGVAYNSPPDKTYATQKKAAELLLKIMPLEPEHPGVAHYIIHALDYPTLAAQALPTARVYAKIAPSVPHALHMPSHIFTRLGLWQESIESNLASADAAKRHIAKTHPGWASQDQLHALDYLMYAYLQTAQDKKAKAVLEETDALSQADYEVFQAAYAWSAIPARYALERHRWAEAAALTVRPAHFPWEKFPYAEANIWFARAIGAARNGDAAAAQSHVAKLGTIRQSLADAKNNFWATHVEIQHRAAAAWLAQAEGKSDEAVQRMRSAADLDDATDKHPVTPGALLPTREMLGDLLLELNQPAPALREYEAALRDAPNRFNAIAGAARAAELADDSEKAKTYYTKLVAQCVRADGDRLELQKAKSFLAGK